MAMAGTISLMGERGSNFLTGGEGQDTFYVDGRGGANTWSTITDLISADTVRLWGWQDGISQLNLFLFTLFFNTFILKINFKYYLL